ncbi:MAG: hypothetical protein ACOH19_09475 [Rhodoglobus sp.]
MIGALLLVMIGASDALRSGRSQRFGWGASIAASLGLGLVAVYGMGMPIALASVCLGITVCWLFAMPTVARWLRREPRRATLRGGRVIGPLERVLLVFLALTGAYPVIAALIAAKGIVRFPEISTDRGSGSKAEEFLVGSFTSWFIAALAAGYLFVLHLA